MSYGVLLIRVFIGLSFFGHGTQKLFGWWGGYGPQGTGGFFGQQGYRNPVALAVVAGACEATGGILLGLGLATPLACALIAIVMVNAIGSVTFKRDAFLLGSELELAYLVTAVGLAAIGPLRFSLDRAIGWDDNISGLWWGVLVLAAAAVVSLVTLTVGRTRPAAASQPAAGA